MSDLTTVILYVRDPLVSVRFYAELLGREPVEACSTFAMIAMAPGVMLGLWSIEDVAPAAAGRPGAGELCLVVPDRDAVHETAKTWRGRGMPLIQEPVEQDFGFTATGTDPDGHRIRVMALASVPA